MRFACLGSGSQGNATLVQAGKTTLMIDCGFSARETERRLESHDLEPAAITAILLTHEHSDHVGGAGRFARKHQTPVYCTSGTRKGMGDQIVKDVDITEFNSHEPLDFTDLQVTPVTVPHDAREPCQYVFSNDHFKLGLLTDTGCVTPHILEHYQACHALLLEFNHDSDQLQNNQQYPASLKQRIAGTQGHLSNAQAADLLSKLDCSSLQYFCAMHLSEKNNSAKTVRNIASQALGCEQEWITIAKQKSGFAWHQLQ